MKPHIYKKNGLWHSKDTDWNTLKGSIANHLAFEWCAAQNGILLEKCTTYAQEVLRNTLKNIGVSVGDSELC